MIKKFTSFTGLRICLLLMSWITSTALLAQTKYSEGPDFPNAVSAATYTLNQAGEYTFSGRVETPGDPQDAFKVIIPTGFKITRAVLNASGGNTQQQPTGFVSFADGTSPDYQAASFSNSSGVNVTRSGDLGPNTANNPYTGLASVDFSVGTTWSIKLTVVSTGTNVCTAPNVPTISATQTSICAGSSTSLSIQSGNLNDATAWKWYTGSCGGTPVGTGTSIQVSPTSTTTYYVRGEGGCVTAGSCASQQITVNPQPNAPGVQNVAYCQGVPASPLTATGINLKYYTTASGGTPSTSVTPSTSNVGMTNYYVSQTNANGCESPRAAISVTVNALPNAPGVQNVAYCQGVPASPLTASGTNLKYYTAATGGTGSVAAPTPPTSTPGTTTYYVSQTNVNGCESPRAAINFTVNPQPNAPGVQDVAYCQGATPGALTATGTNLKYYTSASGGAAFTTITPSTSNVGMTTYYVSQTNATGCESPRAAIIVTVNALPVVAITGLASAYCQDAGLITLSGTPMNGSFTVDGTEASSFETANLTVGSHTVVYSYTNSNGCSNSTSQTFIIKATPTAPTLVTAGGQPFPEGVISLTASQNTGSVILSVSGCSDGTITWGGGDSKTLAVSTSNLGTQTFTATCTQNGCTSPAASFSLTIVPTTLSVLHLDVDNGQTQDQIIKPFLKLSNAGGQAIPYGELTVRYWFTSEGNAPPTDFQVYYAQLGAVSMKYVPLAQPRQGAFGYVEYSFPGGGSLPANGNSGPIETGILKSDRSNFNETDDYSYQLNRSYLANARITAYRNGVIFWGQEPAAVAPQTAVQVYAATKDAAITSQIQTRLELRNTGNVSVPVSSLKLRYYFTSDNGQPTNVFVNYADMGASMVRAQVVRLSSPVNGADSYVELSFPESTRRLSPLSSLGFIDFRLVRSDFGLLNQNNDYSFAPVYGSVRLNSRITAYLENQLIFGMVPSDASARVAAGPMQEVGVTGLQVQVLGNPVVGNNVEVAISGVARQSLRLTLVDLQGRVIGEQRIGQAGENERVSIPLGTSRGHLLLKVNTDTQQQSLRLVRP